MFFRAAWLDLMRLIIVAAAMLATSPCLAQIKIPDACIKVAKAYSMAVPRSLTKAAAKSALDGLAYADQNDADVKACIKELKAELNK